MRRLTVNAQIDGNVARARDMLHMLGLVSVELGRGGTDLRTSAAQLCQRSSTAVHRQRKSSDRVVGGGWWNDKIEASAQ
jgi:hypothetical protein